MEDKQVLTPAKYNGMRVYLDDRNFDEVFGYWQALSMARTKEPNAIKDLLKQLPKTASAHPSPKIARQNYLTLIKSIKQDDLDAFFKQLSLVYTDETLDAEKSLLEEKLRDIQAWLAEPRQLPSGSRVLKQFSEDDFTCFNSHVHRFAKILNQAVLILEQNAIQELREKLDHPSEVIQQMLLLSRAYLFTTSNEDAPVYQLLKTQREEFYSHGRLIRSTFGDKPELSFGYLMELQAIENKIAVTLSTYESRALIALMRQTNASQRSIDELKAKLEAAREQNERLKTRVGTTVVDVTPNLEIEALRREYAEQSAENETLRAERASCFKEIAALGTLKSTEAPPEVIIPMGDTDAQITTDFSSEAPDWDWSFVCQCLCSPTALNCYGALLMIAGALIVAATVVAAIPLVLGVTAAALGVAMSGACFFSARQNHSITEVDTLETPRHEV